MCNDMRGNSEGLREALVKSKRKIVGTKRIGKLPEASSFFGNYFVDWVYTKGYVNDVPDAVVFAGLLYKYNVIVAVYSFVNEFLKDEFLYKFTVDEAEEYELIQKRARSFERAKHVFTSWMALPTKRCSITSRDNAKEEIHGNMLLELSNMIDKGFNGALACQIMLRFGFILPKSKYKGRPDTQIFYAQEKYKFSEEVMRSSLSRSNSRESPASPYEACEAKVISRRHSCDNLRYSVTRKASVILTPLIMVTERDPLERVRLDRPDRRGTNSRLDIPGRGSQSPVADRPDRLDSMESYNTYTVQPLQRNYNRKVSSHI